MQIERAEFLPRQNSVPQCIEFKPDKLNLLSADKDQKKSEFFNAISQIILGRPPESNSGAYGAWRKGSVTLLSGGKKLHLTRDFDSNHSEFCSDQENSIDPEDFLSGLSKDIAVSLFLVGQEEGESKKLSDRTSRLSLLGQFASLSEHNSNIDKAVKLVEDKLEKYPFRDRTYKIDDLITGLNRGKLVLEERLIQLEKERQQAAVHISELKKLEEELSWAKRTQKREEYFQLCLETAELDAKIMKVQQRLLYEADLKRELLALGDLSYFPVLSLRKVQELSAMRQARLSDLERLADEINEGERASQLLEDSFASESEGLDQFTIEDAQQLFGFATNFTLAQAELEQLQNERTQEMRRLKDSGIDFDSISLVRKSLLAIAPSDLEEANQLASEFRWQKDKLANLVEISENTGKQLELMKTEIDRMGLQARKTRSVITALMVISLIITIYINLGSQSQALEVFATIFLTSFVLSAIALFLLLPMLARMKKELQFKMEISSQEKQKSDSAELELSNAITAVESKADLLAKKYSLNSSLELFKKLQTYSNVSARLKQLDVLDHMVANREQQIASLASEVLSTYFERINRKLLKLNAAAITGLASEILRHKEFLRELERNNVVLNHRKSEQRFLLGEIEDLDSVLKDCFRKARLNDPDDIEKSYLEFEQKVQDYKKWESLNHELKRIEKDVTSDILEHDLSTVLNKLQHRRTDAWASMQDLITLYPDILSETIEDAEIGRLGQGDPKSIEEEVRKKEAQAESIRALIRTAAKNFDEFHPKTQHELEILGRDLDAIRHNKAALTLARDSLMRVAQESKSSWSQELSEISEDMLKEADLEVRKIDWNEEMEMTLEMAGLPEPVHELDLPKKFSRGFLKQINWLTRLMLCRYVVRRLPMPVVLEEPFYDLDDNCFAACMRLLMQKLLPHCQLIILTCQRVRHQWFMDRLSETERENVSIIRLETNS